MPVWAVAYLLISYYTLSVCLWHKEDGADKSDAKINENV
jgi:hypothetical protein